jgi:hypothetical protein
MKRPFGKRLIACLSAAFVFASALVGSSPHARAADSPVQGIQISPVTVDLNAEKANVYSLKITVTNVTAGDLVIRQLVNDFRAKDESGNAEVILDEKDVDPTYSMKSWVVPAGDMLLRAKESRVVNVEVRIPANAEAGGHYGVVRWSGYAPGQENGKVSIAASVGVLVLARVNGATTESLLLKDFLLEQDGKPAWFIENGPFTLAERIENNGNVHVKPTGTVTVKDMFGGTVGTSQLNEPARNILPNSIRRFSQDLGQKWMFGRYTAQLDATYGYDNKILTGTMSFWVIPYRLIILILVVLVLLVFLFRFLLKRYKARIVKQAMTKRK